MSPARSFPRLSASRRASAGSQTAEGECPRQENSTCILVLWDSGVVVIMVAKAGSGDTRANADPAVGITVMASTAPSLEDIVALPGEAVHGVETVTATASA